jgi:hypothetical protein
MRDEVDRTTTAGELVYLVVENHGSNAYEIAIKLDGKTAALVALEPNDGYKLYAIQYAYSPERHGREESVEIRFLAANGVRDAHRYATTHGLRTLKRIDPP